MGAAVRVAEAAVGDDESGRGAEDVADSPRSGRCTRGCRGNGELGRLLATGGILGRLHPEFGGGGGGVVGGGSYWRLEEAEGVFRRGSDGVISWSILCRIKCERTKEEKETAGWYGQDSGVYFWGGGAPLIPSGHSDTLNVESGKEDFSSGSDDRVGVFASPLGHQGRCRGAVGEGEGSRVTLASVGTDGAVGGGWACGNGARVTSEPHLGRFLRPGPPVLWPTFRSARGMKLWVQQGVQWREHWEAQRNPERDLYSSNS
ncbi:hypothetical protein GBF38_000210 [Nibea albiflora]|nr:hypothetical protein GBF38_000210 [Nibea albiflora]